MNGCQREGAPRLPRVTEERVLLLTWASFYTHVSKAFDALKGGASSSAPTSEHSQPAQKSSPAAKGHTPREGPASCLGGAWPPGAVVLFWMKALSFGGA